MMKKVLFVINTMGQAGAEKSMTELMKVFDTKLYELHLLVMVNRGEMYNQVPSYVKIHNKRPDSRSVLSIGARLRLIKTVLSAIVKKGHILRELPYLYNVIKAQIKSRRIQYDKIFWKLISDGAPILKEEFDVAIAYLEGAATYYVADHVKATKKAGFIHIDYKKAGYTPYMDHNCYSKMNQIFVVSEDAKNSFLEVYPQYQRKTQLFYNIINAEAIKNLAETGKGFCDDFEGTRLLTIGRLHYQKAYDIAIPVLEKLINEGYQLRWYVLGDGAIRGEIEKLIEKHQVTNHFILLGAVTNPYPYLKQCDLYIHTTRYEGKSIAIEEAQVLGKAIVASDCTGNREQISDEYNGLIVNLEVDEIVTGIKRVLEDKEMRHQFEEINANIKFDYRKNLERLYHFIEDKV